MNIERIRFIPYSGADSAPLSQEEERRELRRALLLTLLFVLLGLAATLVLPPADGPSDPELRSELTLSPGNS